MLKTVGINCCQVGKIGNEEMEGLRDTPWAAPAADNGEGVAGGSAPLMLAVGKQAASNVPFQEARCACC